MNNTQLRQMVEISRKEYKFYLQIVNSLNFKCEATGVCPICGAVMQNDVIHKEGCYLEELNLYKIEQDIMSETTEKLLRCLEDK